DRREPARRLGDEGLGADAVSGRDEHGVAVAIGVEGEEAAEAIDLTDDLGPEGATHPLLDPGDGLVAGGDADARRLVGLTHGLGCRRAPAAWSRGAPRRVDQERGGRRWGSRP